VNQFRKPGSTCNNIEVILKQKEKSLSPLAGNILSHRQLMRSILGGLGYFAIRPDAGGKNAICR